MEKWTTALLDITRTACGKSPSTGELVVILVLAFFALFLVIMKTGKAFKFAMPERGRTIAVIIVGIALSLISATAIKIYLSERLFQGVMQTIVPVSAVAVVLLAIVVPFACFMLKSKYFPTLFSLVLGIAAATAVILMVRAASGAIMSGGKDFSRVKDKTENINAIIDKKQ